VSLTADDADRPRRPADATAYYVSEFDKMLRDNVEELTPHYTGRPPEV
jgi:hypothetical protein